MKFVSFKHHKKTKVGLLISKTRLIDISDIINNRDMIFLISNYNEIKNMIQDSVLCNSNSYSLNEVELLSPIPRPKSLRDAYSFRQHVETSRKNRNLEMIKEFDDFPVYYYSNHNSVIGPGKSYIDKYFSKKLDYELEIAAIIGKECSNVSLDKADDCIFGLTIMNDLSSREIQQKEMKLNLGPAKGKDFGTVLGPCITTIESIKDKTHKTSAGNIYDLELKAKINGNLKSIDNLKNMNWTFAQIIERISKGVKLYPGDVIGSGTCATGCFYELNSNKEEAEYWLKNNDEIELYAEKIGLLKTVIKII
ncbi:MAG: fumarylacetoacetate hydrolase [Candidatus Marinimicrobia bacterium]|nr:fumarylacetoacetate hydrolase [Candidatus Neomarinimicrobiota bacterium]|tara:strand:- start:2331 stop:3254 length:924 start_codon:yes stop_codon:yes gene_type:complete